jgi:hypothetical protein
MTAFGPIASRWGYRMGLRAGDHDRRQFCSDPAIEHQAHAGLQFDCARHYVLVAVLLIPASAPPRPCSIWRHAFTNIEFARRNLLLAQE